jgi:hypothetical protein
MTSGAASSECALASRRLSDYTTLALSRPVRLPVRVPTSAPPAANVARPAAALRRRCDDADKECRVAAQAERSHLGIRAMVNDHHKCKAVCEMSQSGMSVGYSSPLSSYNQYQYRH